MSISRHDEVRIRRGKLSRRSFLNTVSAGALAAGTLSFRDLMSLQAAELRKQNRALILLWMQGGPSQFETFDPKPGTDNGGPTEAIDTAVSGIRIAKGWENTAKAMDEIALIRSMTNKEGNHQRATYQLHTGYAPSGSIKHPNLGSSVAKMLTDPAHELPSVVSVGGTIGAGYLGVDYEPFVVNDPGNMPQNVGTTVPTPRFERRLGLLDRLEGDFASRGGETVVDSHRRLYGKASKLVLSPEVKAFDINSEPTALQEKYGKNQFGRGCLLARRLVEHGVTFIEVRSGNWDTHDNNFERVGTLASQVDPAMAALITDLKDRGMLDRTLVVWMGEFGRTPRVNPRNGRDHYPRVFNALMAGGGVKGGQVIGSSTADGSTVKDRPVEVADFFCTVCKSLEVNPRHETLSPIGRPMKIVDGGEVVPGILG